MHFPCFSITSFSFSSFFLSFFFFSFYQSKKEYFLRLGLEININCKSQINGSAIISRLKRKKKCK